jgi:SAM-dependent methyltransferase
VVDAIFSEQPLADVYDDVDSDRSDLEAYIAMVGEFGVRSVLDIGCGTGTFAWLLAGRGIEVTGVDPAAASLNVARRKRYADRVRWLVGDATSLPPLQVDMVTMTGNVAQVFLTDEDWGSNLMAVRAAMKPASLLVFEVRDPAREGWREWNREQSRRRLEIPGVGGVETWTDLTDVRLPFVSFRMTFVFDVDSAVLTSDSTLRFRSREEIVYSLRSANLIVKDVRDAPDRPDREFVFIAGVAGKL